MILERLGISGANVLGTNYTVTSLTVSDYNPNIDSTVTLTVTVKDVYNRPVVGEEVTVTASDGDFTQLDGSTITAASSVTGTTNNSGQFTLTYTCSEWGLITFSANNNHIQVKVRGWREITAGTGKLWVNDETKTATFYFYRNGVITSEIHYDNAIPSGYRPRSHVRMKAHNGSTIFVTIEDSGTVRITGTSQNSIILGCQITYAYGVQ